MDGRESDGPPERGAGGQEAHDCAHLAEAEWRLAAAQAVARVGTWERDLDTDACVWSAELLRILGVRPGDLAPTRAAMLDLVHPDDRERVRRLTDLVASRPGPVELDCRVVRPDGAERVLHVQMEVFDAEGGCGRRVVGALQDVTQQRDAAARLANTLSLLEATLESTADGLLVVDLAGRIIAHNARFAALWQIPESVISAGDDQRALSFASGKVVDEAAFLAQIDALYRDPERESHDEVRLRDGRILERYSHPQRIDGKPVGRVWSFRDVTERRRAEAARDQLLASERAARAEAQAAAQRATLLAEASRILTSLDHETALASLARRVTEWFADSCVVDMIARSGALRRVASARTCAIGDLPCASLETRTTLADTEDQAVLGVPLSVAGRLVGTMRFFRDRQSAFSAADVELAEDLAGRAALTTELTHLYHQAREALAARDEFLSAAAHELRAPLAALQATTDGLLAGVYTRAPAEGDDPLDRPLRSIGRQVRRFSAVVNGLIDAILAVDDGPALELASADLSAIVATVVERFRADTGGRTRELTLDAPAPVVGRWDRLRLDQVVTTLVSNALRYGACKPVQVVVERREDMARLSVRDHGIGIAPERMPAIFSRFERAGAPRAWGGLGLGLYVANAIVERHHGTIHVESQPGEGSTFVVELPLGGGEVSG